MISAGFRGEPGQGHTISWMPSTGIMGESCHDMLPAGNIRVEQEQWCATIDILYHISGYAVEQVVLLKDPFFGHSAQRSSCGLIS